MYKQILFDCDGVILNSNTLKTEAFYQVAKPFGHSPAQNLVDYHTSHGGVSRFHKIKYFVEHILKLEGNHEALIEQLCDQFASLVMNKMMHCDVDPGLFKLHEMYSNAAFAVVSGGAHHELNSIFESRQLAQLFKLGIHGSPRTKFEIIEALKNDLTQSNKVLFIGDSAYDFKVAVEFNFDFAYISQWSEWKPSEESAKQFTYSCHCLSDLAEHISNKE